MIDPTRHRQLEELNMVELCTRIFRNARNELYLNMRYLDLSLSSLAFEADPGCRGVGTDGFVIYYHPDYVCDLYQRGRVHVNRAYLHMVLHCLFCHMDTRGKREPELWNLACDIAVESMLDDMYVKCIRVAPTPFRRDWYGRLHAKLTVLNAEGVYRVLKEEQLEPRRLERLAAEFLVDDHSFWDLPEDSPKTPMVRQTQWSNNREKVQTEMETMGNQQDEENKSILEQIQVENRERYDYRHFLQRFSVLREEMQVDPDSFDAIFYTYGLSLYGNMPLIEPLETREVRKIEDFVIAIDTSMSTSGELVRAFLSRTYELLQENTSFFRHFNLRILQCDDQLRSDKKVTNARELAEYMENFELIGQSATDFRPVFEHVDRLNAEGAFRHLRGLLYFTDGLGIYPKKRPKYDAAFVMLEGEAYPDKVPSWGIRAVISEDALAVE